MSLAWFKDVLTGKSKQTYEICDLRSDKWYSKWSEWSIRRYSKWNDQSNWLIRWVMFGPRKHLTCHRVAFEMEWVNIRQKWSVKCYKIIFAYTTMLYITDESCLKVALTYYNIIIIFYFRVSTPISFFTTNSYFFKGYLSKYLYSTNIFIFIYHPTFFCHSTTLCT